MTSTDEGMRAFWRGRRVLLTGHTGFKGAWLALWLRELGAEVTGYALAPRTGHNAWESLRMPVRSIIADVRDGARLRAALAETAPQIVLHLAAQALVRESYRDPLETFGTNVMGTATLLEACRDLPGLQALLVVTSDKVYENREEGRPFEESDRLGGRDPYSNSKACAELVTQCFRDSFFAGRASVATARAGNVIGGGDWSTDRVVPDCVRALAAGRPVVLRYPQAVRPWQHVLEPLGGYLALAQALVDTPAAAPRAMNFGPDPAAFRTVSELVQTFSAAFGGRPGWVADGAAHPPEARALTLASTLAKEALGWRPRLSFEESIDWTAAWYRAHAAGDDMAEFTARQIAAYRARAGARP